MAIQPGSNVCVYVNRRKNSNHDADVGRILRAVDNDNFDVSRLILGEARKHRRIDLFELDDGEACTKYAYYKGYFFELRYHRDGDEYKLEVCSHKR